MNTIEFLNLQELTPASDFKNGQAYTSVSVREIMDGKVSDRIEVINSARKHFTLTNAVVSQPQVVKRKYPVLFEGNFLSRHKGNFC